MERDTPNSNRTKDQPDRARLGQLLRAVLPDHVGQIPQKHRQVPGALGNAKVQATEGPPPASLGVPGGRVRTPTEALRSLAGPTSQRPDGGSRMNGDAHVRFCESPRVKPPRATHQSTAHIAKPAVAPETGRFALPRGPHRAAGSGAPARGPIAAPFVARSLVVLCALAGLFALATAAVAQAEPPKLISYGSFSAQEPHAVDAAVEGSGDLFVSSLFPEGSPVSPSTLVKLDPSGKLLSPPSPFGSGHYTGVAVSPANDEVYVLGQESPFASLEIFVYDPKTGALLSSFEVPASDNASVFTDVQIAADSSGNVYVPVVPENKVNEYSPSGTLLHEFTDGGALSEPTSVAVNSSGDIWVAGNDRIVEIDSSGAPVEVGGKPVEIESEGVWSVALDGQGDVFAVVENGADLCGEISSSCVHLVEYSAEGRQIADVGADFFGERAALAAHLYSTVSVDEANHRVYVTDGLKGKIWVFGPPAAPVIGRELTAEVSVSEAKLGALVNPGGISTSYRFEYGPTSAYGSSRPFPEGSVGEGVESRAVWASASGLVAGATYHYRIVATNELGTVYGPDQTFTTLTAEQAACPTNNCVAASPQGCPTAAPTAW